MQAGIWQQWSTEADGRKHQHGKHMELQQVRYANACKGEGAALASKVKKGVKCIDWHVWSVYDQWQQAIKHACSQAMLPIVSMCAWRGGSNPLAVGLIHALRIHQGAHKELLSPCKESSLHWPTMLWYEVVLWYCNDTLHGTAWTLVAKDPPRSQ